MLFISVDIRSLSLPALLHSHHKLAGSLPPAAVWRHAPAYPSCPGSPASAVGRYSASDDREAVPPAATTAVVRVQFGVAGLVGSHSTISNSYHLHNHHQHRSRTYALSLIMACDRELGNLTDHHQSLFELTWAAEASDSSSLLLV